MYIKILISVFVLLSHPMMASTSSTSRSCRLVVASTKETLTSKKALEVLKPKFTPSSNSHGPVIYALLRYGRAVQMNSIYTLNGEKKLVNDWGFNQQGQPVVRISNLDGSFLRDASIHEFPDRAFSIKVIELDHVMKYQNKLVIDRMLRDHPTMTRQQAQLAFDEMKKWFFVKFRAYIEKSKDAPYMYDEMDTIDHAWHAFLLFTDHYTEFGQKFFATYLHHKTQSFMDQESGVIREVENEDKSNQESYINRMGIVNYMRETLGEETIQSWFVRQEFNPYERRIENGIN